MNEIFLSEEKLVEYFDALFERADKDFAAIKKRLQSLPKNEKISTLKNAYNRQVKAWILFAGALGYRANLELFRDPMKPNVLEVDPDIYLRESVLHRMPAYREAQEVIDRVAPLLPQEHWQIILEYYMYFETVIPKIAHLKGFMLADQLLPYTEPGYVSDLLYTDEYHKKIVEWSGVDF